MSLADIVFSPASTFPLTVLAEIFSRAFEGYFVALPSDPVALSARIRQDHIDLAASLVIEGIDRQPAGVAFIARRGDASRLAGMGIAPPWRGQGIGRAVMEKLLEDAHARGERRMLLEVIEQNPAGVRLYLKSGFTIKRRLVGYECANLSGTKNDSLEEIGIPQVADAVAKHGDGDPPWQLAAPTLAAFTPPSLAFRLGPAFALVNVGAEVVTLRSLVVTTGMRRQGHGKTLLRALAARFPGRRWAVPALVPEKLADHFFAASSFTPSALSQFEMVRDCPA